MALPVIGNIVKLRLGKKILNLRRYLNKKTALLFWNYSSSQWLLFVILRGAFYIIEDYSAMFLWCNSLLDSALADEVHDNYNIGAGPASGSCRTMGMIVIPCSMKTLAGIVSVYSDNLVLRAADITLKERRKKISLPENGLSRYGNLSNNRCLCWQEYIMIIWKRNSWWK